MRLLHATAGRPCCALLGVACAVLLASPSAADDTALAKCGVQTKLGSGRSVTTINLAGFAAPQVGDDTLAYHRGADGDWIVDEEVNANDPTIRGLLLSPSGPLLIQMDVRVQGKPFRMTVETWIDEALAVNTKSQPASEESKEPPAENAAPEPANPTANGKSESPAPSGPVMAPNFVPPSPPRWLNEYVRNAPSTVDRYEARWLIAQRVGGPALMQLERFSSNRVSSAPLLQVLDRNSDGTVSREELAQSPNVLATCDFNQDGSIETSELERFRPRNATARRAWRAEPLFMVIDQKTDWRMLSQRLTSLYGKAADVLRKVSEENAKDLLTQKPDLRLTVNFALNPEASEVRLTSMNKTLAPAEQQVRTGEHAIAVPLPCGDLEIEAGQGASPVQAAQVSVGAAVEGYPLLGMVDGDGDKRLSIREQGDITAILSALDKNQDGAVQREEIPIRIRLGIAIGRQVHNLLALETRPLPTSRQSARASAPAWFASMDVDHDGDLTPNEFLGSREKFEALDKNQDGLISSAEAGDPNN